MFYTYTLLLRLFKIGINYYGGSTWGLLFKSRVNTTIFCHSLSLVTRSGRHTNLIAARFKWLVDKTSQSSLRLYRKVLLYLSVDCSPSCQRRPRMSLTKYCRYIGPHNPFFSPTDRSFRAAALLKILSDFHRSPSSIYEILIIPLIIPNFWRISCLTQNYLAWQQFSKKPNSALKLFLAWFC